MREKKEKEKKDEWKWSPSPCFIDRSTLPAYLRYLGTCNVHASRIRIVP